ncbi:Protein of unknown function [Gryllus bimaculatus]|nr:Protein of unknown function [Gryllus bimaculatus]
MDGSWEQATRHIPIRISDHMPVPRYISTELDHFTRAETPQTIAYLHESLRLYILHVYSKYPRLQRLHSTGPGVEERWNFHNCKGRVGDKQELIPKYYDS